MALSDAAKEARSLLKLNISLETNTPNNIKIFEDNRGCEKWTRTLSEPNRTKHIDIAYHHIRDWVKLGRISVVPVETNLQLADALTKALPRPQHEFLIDGKILRGPASILVGVLDSWGKVLRGF